MNATDTLTPPLQTLAVQLAGVSADGALAAALITRGPAISHAEASATVLFDTVDETRLGKADRLALAQAVAQWHGDAVLADHYRQRGHDMGATPPVDGRWQSLLHHAQRVAKTPVAINPADLGALQSAGWSEDAIVTASQIVAYVSFQSRLITGLRLLAGTDAAGNAQPPATAGVWHTQTHTRSGRAAPTAFTRDELGWESWLTPRAAATLSAAETEQLSKAGHLQSDYFMLLARDTPVLHHRTRTDHGIFYSHGGLPRAERELAAAVTSKVNGCIYCASVHARKAAQLSGDVAALDALLAVAPGGDLATGQSPRWQAQIRFAAQLAATPTRLTRAELQALRDTGLTDLELLDLVGAVAFFSWANRLMLTLGEPYL